MTFTRRPSGRTELPAEGTKTTRWTAYRWLSTVGLAVILLGVITMPASAHVHVFLGFGLPVYPYPYAYSYAPPPCYAQYPPYVVYPAPPPPAWVPGHWAWRARPWGRSVRVWVPAHRR